VVLNSLTYNAFMNDNTPINPVRFSLCMIVKDGAHEIGRVLKQSKICWDQVVVLDTGSTDGTQDYIRANFPWVELYEQTFDPFDFSKARNAALKYVNGDVWMWLDSDDTYTEEVALQWRELAVQLHNRAADDPINYIVLPYIYRVDEHDVPVVVQFRERIIRGVDCWEWREPLHEVCHYIGDLGSKHIAYAEFPVVHRPNRRPEESAHRNWKVLHRHYTTGDDSDRTLYYLMRTANGEGNHELALHYGLPLVERHPGGYYEYEGLKGVGEAYAGLYNKTQDSKYGELSATSYLEAIRFEPQRNEARAGLIDLYLSMGCAEDALRHAQSLNVDLPKMIATLATEMYGTYRSAMLALIYFSYLNQPYQALVHHMQAMNCPRPHVTTFQLEKSIRSYIEDGNIGIIYADTAFGGQALHARRALRAKGLFNEVWAYNDPNAIAYARTLYLHMTESPDTLYQNDGSIRLRKFYLDPHHQETDQLPCGYEAAYALPATKSELDIILDEITSDYQLKSFRTAKDIVRLAKQARTPKIGLTFETVDADILDHIEMDTLVRGEARFLHDKNGKLIFVAGWVDDIVTAYVDSKNHFKVPSSNSVSFEVMSEETFTPIEGRSVQVRVDEVDPKGKQVVFVAPGIEDWDGTTPYRWGIGASESCVVYLANEMAERGCNVRVFTTVANTRLVNGVLYVPIALFKPDMEPWDLLIASRSPEVLNGPRKAKRQVLWMHDVPDAYAQRLSEDQVIDHYVTISAWQHERAANMNYRHSKLRLIPNGVHERTDRTLTQPKVKNRTVWISQPERGVEALHGFWAEKPEMFNDVWVAYGFYNITRYGHQNAEATFLEVAYWKHVLKSMNAKLVGRVPNHQLTALLDTADRWLYPSKFPETFCVSGVEALRSGLRCFVCENGATAETMRNACNAHFAADIIAGKPGVTMLVCNEGPFDYKTHSKQWLYRIEQSDNVDAPAVALPNIQEKYYWGNVVEQWMQVMNNGR
jgi:glycosyltransferase involved in cell wall biosynthesis